MRPFLFDSPCAGLELQQPSSDKKIERGPLDSWWHLASMAASSRGETKSATGTRVPFSLCRFSSLECHKLSVISDTTFLPESSARLWRKALGSYCHIPSSELGGELILHTFSRNVPGEATDS